MRVLQSGLLLAVLLVPSGSQAGDHNADAFVAPSYAYIEGSSSLGGWHVSGAITRKDHREWSFVGDISVHFFGSDGDKDLTQITLMVGPRRTFRGGNRAMYFTHVMALGAVYRSDGRLQVSNAAGALALGGGVEWVPGTKRDLKTLQVVPGSSGWRFQVDYIRPFATDMKWSTRISLGWIYRFHEKHS